MDRLIINYEELSFYNLVRFYREELLAIYEGRAKASEVFTAHQRKRLIKIGALRRGPLKGAPITLTSKGLGGLEDGGGWKR